MHSFIFPVVISLAQGMRLAVAPWYLAFFYARLDECSRNITQSIRHCGFLYRCQLLAIVSVGKVLSHLSYAWGRRWYRVTWPVEAPRRPLLRIIDEEGRFYFRPILISLEGSCKVPSSLNQVTRFLWSIGRTFQLNFSFYRHTDVHNTTFKVWK